MRHVVLTLFVLGLGSALRGAEAVSALGEVPGLVNARVETAHGRRGAGP